MRASSSIAAGNGWAAGYKPQGLRPAPHALLSGALRSPSLVQNTLKTRPDASFRVRAAGNSSWGPVPGSEASTNNPSQSATDGRGNAKVGEGQWRLHDRLQEAMRMA